MGVCQVDRWGIRQQFFLDTLKLACRSVGGLTVADLLGNEYRLELLSGHVVSTIVVVA